MYFDRQFGLDETIEGIERVTAEDVVRVARDLFANGSLGATVLGQQDGLRAVDGAVGSWLACDRRAPREEALPRRHGEHGGFGAVGLLRRPRRGHGRCDESTCRWWSIASPVAP